MYYIYIYVLRQTRKYGSVKPINRVSELYLRTIYHGLRQTRKYGSVKPVNMESEP